MSSHTVLVSGLGSIGRRHARNVRRMGLADVVLHRTRCAAPPPDLADLACYADLDRALSEAAPTVVIVASPTASHVPVATAAARAGCHVFIEKPLSHSLDGVDELARCLAGSGRFAMVGYMTRFHPLYRRAKRLVDGGAVGRPVYARAIWGEDVRRWHPWEDYRNGYAVRRDLGGGAALTLSHEIDLLLWLFGPPTRVLSMTDEGGPIVSDCEQSVDLLLRFRGGLTASVHLDYWQHPRRRELEIVGTHGRLLLDASAGELRVWWEGSGPRRSRVPRGFRRNHVYIAELRHFFRCIEAGQSPQPDLAAGAETVRVALAARAGDGGR